MNCPFRHCGHHVGMSSFAHCALPPCIRHRYIRRRRYRTAEHNASCCQSTALVKCKAWSARAFSSSIARRDAPHPPPPPDPSHPTLALTSQPCLNDGDQKKTAKEKETAVSRLGFTHPILACLQRFVLGHHLGHGLGGHTGLHILVCDPKKYSISGCPRSDSWHLNSEQREH